MTQIVEETHIISVVNVVAHSAIIAMMRKKHLNYGTGGRTMQDNQFTNVGKMQKRYIDAERTSALIQSRLDGLEFMENKDKAEGYEMAICAILRIIEHSSATDIAEVRHGEWEYIEVGKDESNKYYCYAYHTDGGFCWLDYFNLSRNDNDIVIGKYIGHTELRDDCNYLFRF